MLKAEDLRNESEEELALKVKELRADIYKQRSERLDSKSQKTHLIRQKKKEIARILTCLKEKKHAEDEGDK